ncbi:MAG: response regulator [Gammaproteobacteria bacterium]|nr:response regulator [Gammaproteobacteria bacterium]
MISPTLNSRILLLAVLPATVVSVIFFGYFVKQQIDDIEANMTDKGNTLVRHLASASEYGLFSGNMTILSPLIESALIKNDVISISITNSQGTPLLQKFRDKNNPLSTSTSQNTHKRIFSQPIIQRTVDLNDFESSDTRMPPMIGWVIVEASNETARQKKQDAIRHTLFITLLTLVTSIFLTLWISRYITVPISSLSNAVREIENGNLDVSIKTHPTSILLTLEKGVGNMLKSIKSSHQETQDTIELATEKLRESLQSLEQKNAELTVSQRRALSANQEKSAFLTNISHEIETPLNKVLSAVTLLKSADLTQEQTSYLFTIEQSAKNLLGIINSVLDFSKIEVGNISINDIHFNLKECVEDVLVFVAPSAHEKGIEISSLYYDDMPRALFGAMNCVRQILINLMTNAITLSSAGTIMVRTMLESQQNNIVQIKISITSQHDDTGLELSLATPKSLTEAIHGKTGVESDKGKDSGFWFTFQCQRKDTPKLIGKSDNLPYTNKSITLYDANELTRVSLTHAFQHLGFEVTESLNIENLCTPPETVGMPDICVLSISSHEATEAATQAFLEKHRNYAHSKILVIVSESNPLTLKKLRDWGADACLSKPFRQVDFEKRLITIFRSPKNFYGPTMSKRHRSTTSSRLDGLNILIAEDNAINATLIETILCRSGAIPHIVDNGKKAVSAFTHNEDKFDLILMDIHMPEMNGVDAARKIRETETHIAIIGLTAASQNRNSTLSQNPDFDEILEKPIAVNTLLTTITYWAHAHESSEDNKPAYNKSTSSLGIDKNLSTTLNEMLLHELPETKEKLQSAYNSGDSLRLRDEVHRLLGGMAYCDFAELHQLTLHYQASLNDGKKNMEKHFQKMIAEIDHLLIITKNP